MKRIENIEEPFVKRMPAPGFPIVEIQEDNGNHKCTKLEKLSKGLTSENRHAHDKYDLYNSDNNK